MPSAVVVGSDATALHVGARLLARGFDVTLLESTQVIGGQWVQRLHTEKAGATGHKFSTEDDVVFLDFPLLPPRPPLPKPAAVNGLDPAATDPSLARSSRPSWTDQPISSPASAVGAAPAPPTPVDEQQQLLRHLAEYAQAGGLHRSVRLGCTLRRAKWQAMNGCWRLEIKNDSPNAVQQRVQLSTDLLVVSKMAAATPRLPYVPGGELYCGTILTANEQLAGPGGDAVLEQTLRGRNVLVVAAAGPAAATWVEACRRHAGATGSVVLLEVEDEQGQPGAAGGRGSTPGASGRGGKLSRLFGACFGRGGGDRDASVSGAAGRLERYSPAQCGEHRPSETNSAEEEDGEQEGDERSAGVAPGAGAKATAEEGRSSGDDGDGDDGESRRCRALIESGRGCGNSNGDEGGVGLQDAEEADGDGDGYRYPEPTVSGMVLDSAPVTTVGKAGGAGKDEGAGSSDLGQSRLAAAVMAGAAVRFGGGGEGEGGKAPQEPRQMRQMEKQAAARGSTAVGGAAGGRGDLAPLPHSVGGGVAAGEGPRVRMSSAGRSSLRVLRGVTALLNGTHATLSTGEELPAEVVLLVPLAGTEVSLAFLDAGGPGMRGSQAGGSSVGGSFRRGTTAVSLNGSTTSVPEVLSRQLVQDLYRDMLSSSPAAPNLALVGMGPEASQHDARAAAVQTAWLLATWAWGQQCAAGAGGGAGPGGALGGDLDGGFLRQASPGEATADVALRLKWRQEAARRGRQELYLHRYLQQMLADLGVAPQPPPKCLCGRATTAAAANEPLTRQKVARLLGIKRLVRLPRPSHDEERPSPQSSHCGARPRGYSCNGGGNGAMLFGPYGNGFAAAAAVAAAASDRASGPLSRDASLSSFQGGGGSNVRHSASAVGVMRTRGFGAFGGGVGVGNGPGSFELPARSEGSSFGLVPPGLAQQLTHTNLMMSTSRGSATSFSRGGAGGGGGTNVALTMTAPDQQLYCLVEHPSEHPQANGGGGGGVVSAGQHPTLNITSCPSSPGLALPHGAACSTRGSISGSGVRGRMLASTGAGAASGGSGGLAGPGYASFSSATNTAHFGNAAGGGAPTSPCLPSGGGGGGAGGAVGAAAGPGEDVGSQQRPPAQLLTRHRSTSRLAGVSNASSGTAPQASGGLFGGLSFRRRTVAVSTSQVSFDMSSSTVNERRSQSGRPSTSRRTPYVSAGSSHNVSSAALLGRVNSAARLQLLVAAANSASRRRNVSTASPSGALNSPFDPSYGSYTASDAIMSGVLMRDGHGLQKAYSEALQPLHRGADGLLYSGTDARGLKGRPGGRQSGLGTSVAALARAAARASREGAEAGALVGVSVSEPVRTEDMEATIAASAPTSPARRNGNMYGNTYSSCESGGDFHDAVADDGANGVATDPTAAAADVNAPPSADSGQGSAGQRLTTDGASMMACRRRARRRSITLPDLRYGDPMRGITETHAQLYFEDDEQAVEEVEGEGSSCGGGGGDGRGVERASGGEQPYT